MRQRGLQFEKQKHEKGTIEELKQAIDEYCRLHPNGKITHARKQVAKNFKYTDYNKEGARYVAKRTGHYNPYLTHKK